MVKFLILLLLVTVINAFPEEENDDLDGLLFGGDMMLTPEQRILVETGGDISLAGLKQQGRAAMKNISILWFQNGKTVPYTIHPELEIVAEATFGMMQAFREWEERSCLSFKRRTNEEDYVEFFINSGCWSYVGKQGGGQNISLADGCWGKGTIVHEIGHAMGFGHEQNRPDRDDYITVRWENVPERKKHNFQKYSDKRVDSLNSPYDYKSFMQYSKTAFGVNDSVTLDPKKKDVFQLGQRVGFTYHDQYQVMELYQCNGTTTRKAEVHQHYTVTGDDTCDFEHGMCHYTQDTKDDFDWSRRYGGTPSGNTGPDADHTTSRLGTFVYMEASSPQKENDTARLKSKIFDTATSEICLNFFFHMFSTNKTHMGEFNVYTVDKQSSRNMLMTQNGSMIENDWIEKRLSFKPQGKYQVVFEGIRGGGFQGDIAIDDISFTKGACPPLVKKDVNKLSYHDGDCSDTKDREAPYCKQWKTAGYCSVHEKVMMRFCSKTCQFCK